MALQKEIIYKGVSCNYWKITRIDAEYDTVVPNTDSYTLLRASVVLYKDATIRAGSVNNYLLEKQYTFLKSSTHSPANTTIDKVYKALKRLQEFSGAIDV